MPDELDLDGLEYHAHSSGTDTPPMMRKQILLAIEEIKYLRAREEKHLQMICSLRDIVNEARFLMEQTEKLTPKSVHGPFGALFKAIKALDAGKPVELPVVDVDILRRLIDIERKLACPGCMRPCIHLPACDVHGNGGGGG